MHAWAAADVDSGRRVDRSTRAAELLTALYEAYAVDAFRYALYLTGRREDAEDVVQHVFLQAYASLEAGRGLANPRAWLLRATKHRSLNLIRDRRDAPIAEIDPPARDVAPDGEAEALAEVRAVLWSLPQPQHHAFVLRHWSGLSQDEIAEVLATTPHAVESLLVRARAALVAERDAGDPECVGVRRRLVRLLEPTPAQAVHVAGCRRCRTAQMRLLRASEHAAAFALVPGPHVLHTLAAAVPGFGASGAVAGGAVGSGGAAASVASGATKAGIVTKIAVAATTAAVAVTAVHPLRSAVTHSIVPDPPATSAAAPTRAAAHTVTAPDAAPIRAGSTARGTAGAGNRHGTANGERARHGRRRPPPHPHRGKSGTAGSNGRGHGRGHGRGSAHGNSASAPGHTKAPGSKAATGRGAAKHPGGNGHSHSHAGHPPSGGDGHKGKG
jgi:RNA polymerase sigma-70 factor, ECF subfamily